MYTPNTETMYVMDMSDLDKIATRVYKRPYSGQQTGDMMPNDSYHVYDMDEEYVLDVLYLGDGEKRHYLGLQRVPAGTGDHGGNFIAHYAEGVNQLEYWLGLKWDAAGSTGSSELEPWEDARSHIYRYDFEVYRQAPEPDYILADLITRGELPYGKYLIEVCW